MEIPGRSKRCRLKLNKPVIVWRVDVVFLSRWIGNMKLAPLAAAAEAELTIWVEAPGSKVKG